MQNQRKQSNFKGITLKVFKNKYKAKPTSYDFKGDGDEFFLKKLGEWLKTPDIKQERANGNPLKIGVRMTEYNGCLLYTSPSPRDRTRSRMPSSA